MPPLRRLFRWALVAFAGLFLLGLVAVGVLYYLIAPNLPDVETLRDVEMQEPMYVYSRDGQLMALFGETRRYPAKIEQVPERLKQAFIAIEDARFYQHHGVDYKGTARAVWLLATTDGKRVPGGSTITQQVARQFYLSSEVSYTRKLTEMLLAMRMERELSKDEIFELYLNKSFFGNRAYGVAAAAEFYYGKQLAELSLDEMASLAGIPKFPSSGNPLSNPERAKQRRDYILERMAELKFVSRAEAEAAKAVPMHAAPHERPVEVEAPYVAEMVRQAMVDRFGAEALTKGYHVTTTIDPVLQAAADKALRDGLHTYDLRHGWHGVEKHLELAAGETAEQARVRLRGISQQAALRPALVLAAADRAATVVLADGTTVELGADQGWNGRNPASLVKRGDVVRVTRMEPPKDAKPGTTPASARYRLAQVPRAQAALVSLEADTGALRALAGGYSFAGNKFNRATQARRQPGSSFKPFVYAAAMERGFNPASIVLDAPVVFKDRRGHVWRPQNDTGNFAGPMRLREAMVQSRNLVSVRMLDAIGVDYARKYISHFGFAESDLPPNLSMSLGTASLTPISVAQGYATFSNGGFRVSPWFIDEVKDRDGAIVFKEKPAVACRTCAAGVTTVKAAPSAGTVVDGFDFGPADGAPKAAATAKPAAQGQDTPAAAPAPLDLDKLSLAPRAIDNRIAYQIVSMLRDVVLRGTGTAAKVLGREDVGGKTGSTNDHRDAWFSGFGGSLATTVWVGRDNFQSLGYREYGGKAALPIWIDYMRVALKDQPIRANDPPDGMVQVSVGPGGRLIPDGGTGIVEWVKAEDLERMESYVDYGPEEAEAPAEESFDIF
ncbi:penicillin-binding protein 1A [Aerolutibacter ruishenii]|uniref:Penicillin-binding protein 1A n=1 Tax=Aerolutibacter ruishenii TaxID=686800 RepID=A0A562LJZ8_9GAMM|nr:penicillin-binding protein 1A [Lysobacter ruishenii]TWI07937.1 penicillin-binding protein 1A [Lysobacter ruishenii]